MFTKGSFASRLAETGFEEHGMTMFISDLPRVSGRFVTRSGRWRVSAFGTPDAPAASLESAHRRMFSSRKANTSASHMLAPRWRKSCPSSTVAPIGG